MTESDASSNLLMVMWCEVRIDTRMLMINNDASIDAGTDI